MNSVSTDILIVGGGPAGMSAALAAAGQASVLIIDDNPHLGGQIWRAELGKRSEHAAELIDAIDRKRISIINNGTVVAADSPQQLHAVTQAGPLHITADKLIIATGARERFIPFPGWTLPGVTGAAGLQALVKGGFDVEGKRIVVAGTGPLLLVVAAYLRSKGAEIAAIAEQASAAKLARFGLALARHPHKVSAAASIRRQLRGIRYLTSCWVNSAGGNGKLEYLGLTRKGRQWRVDCDLLACGFHLVPNTELASLLGCELDSGFVRIDPFQRTTIDGVYCAGEPTGIGGVEASLIEGTIAGLAAAGSEAAAGKLFKQRDRTRAFMTGLDATFALRNELRSLVDGSTIVCRCEDVRLDSVSACGSWREAKLQTRCGMGPCQGRICGPAVEFLFGWQPSSVRPPIFPVKMNEL